MQWDDALLEAHFFSRLSHLVPAMVINAFAHGQLWGGRCEAGA